MSENPTCTCGAPFQPGDLFCARCGRPSGQVEWSLSRTREGARGPVAIRPGDSFFLLAHNRGYSVVHVQVEAGGAAGVRLEGASSRHVAPGAVQAFELVHLPGEEVGGALLARSEDAPRRQWWDRRGWREEEVRLHLRVRIREEQWVVGSGVLLFPAGVRTQRLRIWNDADQERPFHTHLPAGYTVSQGGEPLGATALAVPADASFELEVQAASLRPGSGADREWTVGPYGAAVVLERLPGERPEIGADAVIALDFGTRNTGVRVRWRRTLLPGKPAGTVDSVGDRGSSARFPSQMVLHLKERTFRWGEEAAAYIAASRMTDEEVAVGNLKTYLREGDEAFISLKPEWTNAELLGRYFERIFGRIDEYFRTADPVRPLFRSGLDLRYVVCRPVLDVNEGDGQGRRYEEALMEALRRCGVSQDRVSFVLEPTAAAVGIARRREAELLQLPEGSAVAVVDSGGGTTDITMARVRFGGGQVGLEVGGSYALRLAGDNPAVRALQYYRQEDRVQVGGNVLDWTLAYTLTAEANKLLESDGKPVPRSLWLTPEEKADPDRIKPPITQPARLREFVIHCRRMKERFAKVSTQYLNRPPGAPREEGEVLPFPNRPDFQGVYLVHALYDEHVLAPVLRPPVGELSERIAGARGEEAAIRLAEVRRVFYVGGTCIDPFVRRHFGRAFPVAPPENDPGAQDDRRIAERLNAVVEGAVWADEQLFAPCPHTLRLRLREKEHLLAERGAALPPAAVASPRFFTDYLEPGEELEACLIAAAGGLEEPRTVCRAFFRNEADVGREVTLAVSLSKERGATADLVVGGESRPQWRFALAPEAASV